MVHFCEAVVEEIKSAYNLDEVEDIVRKSFVLFKERKSADLSKYIINMIVIVRINSTEAKTTQEHANFTRALEIFRNHQRTTSIALFLFL
jgi:hypothetical protein